MVKRSFLRLFSRVISISDGSAMHEQYRMMPIFPNRSGGEAVDIFRVGGFKYLFIR